VGSTGLAAAKPEAPASPVAQTNEGLPTNHPFTKDQLKAMKKAQARIAKAAKKNGTAATPAGATPATAAPATTPTAPQ
jgi:hypothetical protein